MKIRLVRTKWACRVMLWRVGRTVRAVFRARKSPPGAGPGGLAAAMLLASAGFVVVNVLLMWAGVRVFQRETILTRWR